MTLLAVCTTVASMDDARRLADVALAERLAACVQPSATESHFRWSGQVRREEEIRLLPALHYARLLCSRGGTVPPDQARRFLSSALLASSRRAGYLAR